MQEVILSSLNHTWFIDIDGTICKHNGYKIDGHDTLLSGVKDFFDSIPSGDLIILVTSRTEDYKELTINFLLDNNIRFNHIIFNAPYGERIIINDNKPSGLETGKAMNIKRNSFDIALVMDENK